jgi:hypothetical protein
MRVLARVGEALLHDPEDLDLLVGGEADPVPDLEIDLELAVPGEEVDVASRAIRARSRRRPTELGEPDRAPDADEQDAVGDQA